MDWDVVDYGVQGEPAKNPVCLTSWSSLDWDVVVNKVLGDPDETLWAVMVD